METLTRRFNTTFGTWSGLKHSLRHGKSLSSIVMPTAIQNWSEEPEGRRCSGHSRTASAASAHGSLGSVASRSVSLNSVSSEGSFGETSSSNAVDQEDIVALTQHVRSFKDALGRLRRIFHPQCREDSVRISAHEKLGEVLRILRSILEKYGALQSTELLTAAGQLIQQIKSLNFEDEKVDPTEFFEAIDKLALAFSSRVSEYLMGDLDTSSAIHPAARTRSCENLSDPDIIENGGMSNKFPDVLSPQQIDETLMRLEHGVGVALQRAKVWAKYANDVILYIEKRSTLETEYSRNIAKLAQSMRSVLKEESFLPFQSIYCSALNYDMENANLSQATCSLLLGHKFIEPLNSRRIDHEKTRKNLKVIWQKESKKMHDGVNNLRKARALYYQRQQEYEKAKESSQRMESMEGADTTKLDKKKRAEEDTLQKAMEAETTYKACVVEANERHQNLEKVKGDILKQVRELILQCDQTMKAATVGYFQLQHTFSAPAPVQFQTLCEDSRTYEPGFQYMEYIKRLPVNSDAPVIQPPPFSFEPYVPTDSRLNDKERRANGTLDISEDCLGGNSGSNDNKFAVKSKPNQCTKTWSHSGLPVNVSDSDSMSSQSNKSLDTSPYSSPMISSRHRIPSSHDEFDLDPESVDSTDFAPKRLSKAAESHDFRKLKTPSKCRECDTYVYFQGVECTECGLTCHKKCAETLAIQCGHKRLKPKLTTFGVNLSAHVAETQTTVPHLVNQCIQEIELRGMNIKGIYRVSGVKSKVEKLCQSFENGVELVDLTEIHPNVIANVLKLYFRQLPEPLLTFRLYPEFVQTAKKYLGEQYTIDLAKKLSDDLKVVVQKLPQPHYATLALLMMHLKKVWDNSAINNMPASNLGIVFGPTLLRRSEGNASLSSLIDMDHQIRVVELLIQFTDILFNNQDVTPETVVHLAGKVKHESKSNEPHIISDDDNAISEELSQECKYSSDDRLALTTAYDENSSAIISDEELLESILLPDYSAKEGSLLFPFRTKDSYQFSTKSKQNELKPHLSKHDQHESYIYESIDEARSSSRNKDIFAPDTDEVDTEAKESAPLPPPRRHSANPRQSRSPCPSDSDSISIGSLTSLSNSLQSTEACQRIIIHVQSASHADSLHPEGGMDHIPLSTVDSEKSKPLRVIVDDTLINTSAESKEEIQVNLDSKNSSETKTCAPTFATDTESDASSLPRSTPPTPSPRLSRMKNSDRDHCDGRNSSNIIKHSPNSSSGASSLSPSTDALSPCSYSSPYSLSQPSPVPSIPSTSSSLDELDHFTSLPSSSPSPNEYASTESFKSIHLTSDSGMIYTQSTAFSNFNKSDYQTQDDHSIDTGSGDGLSHDNNGTLLFSRTATRTASCPSNELGSRNSVLRSAITFRHQRYSPAYSTASTKSSGSSSPPPEVDEIGDCPMMESRHSPKPIPRTSLLSTQHNVETSSSIFGIRHVSKDGKVFVQNVGHENDQPVNQKRPVETRAPRFV